ncbi:MAG: hypothetical protein IJP34_06385 [Clostridia bacterium]|nr:hypothetical protein [Clostridia bacterium]
MADLNNQSRPDGNFKEAVCIDAGRIYDSCCDRDCLEDLRCFFLPEAQELINNAVSVRLRNAKVLNVSINVEPVNFNKGFYSCDLTFFFLLDFDLYTSPNTCPVSITGITSYSKRVILYGSDGNVKVFSSTACSSCEDEASAPIKTSNCPKCVVQVVEPIPLSARIGEIHNCYENLCCVPKNICDCIGGNVVTNVSNGSPAIFASIGLFSIVQLVRNVQMLIPVYDFCLPEKTCTGTTEGPCDAFKKIKFPTDDFFPPQAPCSDCGCCGSDNVES